MRRGGNRQRCAIGDSQWQLLQSRIDSALLREWGKVRGTAERANNSLFGNIGLPEKWYRCIHCGTVWRLVEPDPPFGGLWKKVP